MSKTVVLPYDPTWKALEWAKSNCKSYITNDGVIDQFPNNGFTRIEYFFANEKDATMFRLRWV